jgi:hypothetical protein
VGARNAMGVLLPWSKYSRECWSGWCDPSTVALASCQFLITRGALMPFRDSEGAAL